MSRYGQRRTANSQTCGYQAWCCHFQHLHTVRLLVLVTGAGAGAGAGTGITSTSYLDLDLDKAEPQPQPQLRFFSPICYTSQKVLKP